MNKIYFLDTSFIIAYGITTDENHLKTKQLEEIILNETCCINNSVLNECVTVCYNKTKSVAKSQEIYYILLDSFKLINEYEIVNFNNKTINIFNKHNGKLSFTDAGIIITMNENNIKNLLTFDKGFRKEKTINVN